MIWALVFLTKASGKVLLVERNCEDTSWGNCCSSGYGENSGEFQMPILKNMA